MKLHLRALVALMALVLAGAVATFSPASVDAASAATRPRVVTLARPLVVRPPAGASLTVWSAPRTSATPQSLPPTTGFGSATVLLATARKGSWYRVVLPTRPNGSTAWVRTRDVSLHPTRDQLRVDLAARTLTWTRDGRVVLETPVAIGAPDTPTPTGAFSVTDLLDNADDSGAYGPFALGLAAHSNTLSEFAGGDGQIGLHGTNEPWSIGQAVSHGCVRVPNDVVARLATSLPLGTPVTIV
jgi:lipoprotein-anchoring transpeptidase ErfK/SrfK